ncbi:MAG TPA: nitrogenase iron-molybdenum cofactor biosynthesis protein NifN [Rhodomicrobium sp.]|nr:nitrogenase iron-molybdenum cofactor biosynthesis protein NifN [Rhodomicrobium sp.]
MAKVEISKKACTVNPLKMSQPIGGALAFMGVNGCMPLLHGSQGCTSFGLVLFVRHFREAIPMQTTAMSEVATVLGGYENVEQAVITIANRAKPAMIGICSTGVTEIKGDDVDGFITLIRQNRPELNHLPLVYCSTPDFKGAFQDGWAATVTRMVEVLVETPAASATREANRITILPGCHLTPGDLEEVRDIVEAFGLAPSFLPDLSGSLDGHIPETFTPTTIGGISVEEIARLGRAAWTIAIGEQMRAAAVALEKKTGAPFKLFDRLTGLAPNDAFIAFLAKISGKPVPNKYRRQRSQLLDAMLDGHFSFGGKKIAVGAEPDLLFGVSSWLAEMGCSIAAAVTTTESPILEKAPAEAVLIGDLEDLEHAAGGCDLIVTHAHGRQMSERLGIPLFRYGMPIFDRLGSAHRVSVGYRGTRDLIFEIGNIFMAQVHEPTPDSWRISHDETNTGAALTAH